MSAKLTRKLPHLMVIKDSCPKVRKAIFKHCDKTLVDVLSECVYNAIKNPDVRLSRHCVNKLRPYQNTIREFAHPKVDWKRKKSILVKPQTGGWIIPILTSVLGSAIPYLLKKLTGTSEK